MAKSGDNQITQNTKKFLMINKSKYSFWNDLNNLSIDFLICPHLLDLPESRLRQILIQCFLMLWLTSYNSVVLTDHKFLNFSTFRNHKKQNFSNQLFVPNELKLKSRFRLENGLQLQGCDSE